MIGDMKAAQSSMAVPSSQASCRLRRPGAFLRAGTILGVACLFVLSPGLARAQQHEGHGQHGAGQTSPYAEHVEREIEALSREEVDGLLAGEGIGMALPAELHGYPGPRHVLDLATELELTPSQLAATEAIFEAMRTRARELGREIVDLERELDAAFEEETVTADELDRLVGEIGRRRAELRGVHLGAHLELRPILTREQRGAYDRLRGYRE